MRTITVTLAVLAVAGAAVWASAQPETKSLTDGMDGADLYKAYCSSCHGASGNRVTGPSRTRSVIARRTSRRSRAAPKGPSTARRCIR